MSARGAGRGAAGARGRGGWLHLACAALLAFAACGRVAGTKASDGGADMANGVSMRRLGKVSPHMQYIGTTRRDYVDPSPVVLWRGDAVAAALYLHVESDAASRSAVQRLAAIDERAGVPGFPIANDVRVPASATSEDAADAIDTRALVSADVDGDGVQELVVTRRHGGVEVHGLRGKLADYPSPSGGFRRLLTHALELGGRDVVYSLSTTGAKDQPDRNLLLRIDRRGVTRVPLRGLEGRPVLALGAIQRHAGQEPEELLALVADGGKDTALARLRPDGTLIAPPRRLYVRASPVNVFDFVPRSSRAVLVGAAGVLVLSPEKPVDWIREIKVRGSPDPHDLQLLQVVDTEGDPKLVYAEGQALWAVNHDGDCFAPAGGGRWVQLPKHGPWLTVPLPDGARPWALWPVDERRLFAVATRPRRTRPMTHDDWRRAADRYLPPAEASAFRKKLEPSLEGFHPYRDDAIREERQDRRVEAEVRTVEDWKRLLPRSFAEVAAADAKDHDVQVEARLRRLAGNPQRAPGLPDPAALRAFVDALDLPASTIFTVVEGTATATVSVPGMPLRDLETQVSGPVEYRLHGGGLRAILALQDTGVDGEDAPAFYLVEARLGGDR